MLGMLFLDILNEYNVSHCFCFNITAFKNYQITDILRGTN